MFRIRTGDPVLCCVFLTIQDGKKSGSRMNIPDHISESLVTIFWIIKYLNSLMRIRIRDLFDPASRIRDEKIWILDLG
jgi:hypothetical protein